MRLKSMTIKNFKGIDEHGVRIDFAPITMLFGPNNAGKSTIIQGMHLAREILCRNNADTDTVEGGGSGISLGSFRDYVHKHEEHREVSLRFDMEVDTLPIYWNEYEQELYHDVAYEAQDLLYNVDEVGVELGIIAGVLKSYVIYINKEKFTKLEVDNNSCKFSGCTVACILDEDILSKIQQDTEAAWAAIDASPDDYGNEVLDAKDNILEHIPRLLLPFVKKDSFDNFGFPEIFDEDHSFSSPIGDASDGSVYMSFDEGKHLDFDDASVFRDEIWLTAEDHADEGSELVASLAVVRPLLLASLILGPGKLLRDELNRLLYIGPLRQVPPRSYTPCKYNSLDRWANGLAAWDIIATATEEQRNKINAWLDGPDSLETGYTLQLRQYSKLEADSPLAEALVSLLTNEDFDDGKVPLLRQLLLDNNKYNEWFLQNETTRVAVQPRDMGTGISQVIPVVVAGALAKPDSLVAIEQPELHIHPRLQVVLGDLFIKAVTGHDRPPIFLLETHSEHLLLRLLRRIRQHHEQTGSPELAFTPEQIAVFWIGQNEGRVFAQRLGIDEDGSFNTPWPEGFFDERGEELFG